MSNKLWLQGTDFNDRAIGAENHYGVTINTSVKKMGASSYLFASGYIGFPISTNWNLANLDWTFNVYVYMPAVSGDRCLIGQCDDLTNRWVILLRTVDNTITFYAMDSGLLKSYAYCTFTPSINTWYNIEVSRYTSGGSSVIQMFADGVKKTVTESTAIGTKTLANTLAPLMIGMQYDTTYPSYFAGYMDEIYLAVGEAEHTADFTPRTTERTIGDGITAYTKLYMKGNNDSYNNEMDGRRSHPYIIKSNYLPNYNNATLDGTNPKFNTVSGKYVASSYQYTAFPDSPNWYFADGKWTMRGWYNLSTLPASGSFFILASQVQDGNNRWLLCIYNSSGTYKLMFYGNSATVAKIYELATISISTGNWYYMECSRSGATLYMSMGGTILTLDLGGTHPGTNSLPNLTASLEIGRQYLSGNTFHYNGFIGEFAIDKGDSSLIHTSNYSVPTNSGEFNNGATVLYVDFKNRFEDVSYMALPQVVATTKNGIGAISIPLSDKKPKLVFPLSNDWRINSLSSNFMIDFWIYFYSTTAGYIMGCVRNYTQQWYIYFTGSALQLYSSSLVLATMKYFDKNCAFTPNISQWYHIKISKVGDSFYMSIDESQQTVNSVIDQGDDAFYHEFYLLDEFKIGSNPNGANADFIIDDLKISKGNIDGSMNSVC
jgi:hypothetical protein